MKTAQIFFSIFYFLLSFNHAFSQDQTRSAGCSSPTSKIDLDINNVRARITAGGDLFRDSTSSQFEVPKGSGKGTVFAGNLWIGGVDAGGQLKMAANTYRQSGTDFWAGPVSNSYAAPYDNIWNRV